MKEYILQLIKGKGLVICVSLFTFHFSLLTSMAQTPVYLDESNASTMP